MDSGSSRMNLAIAVSLLLVACWTVETEALALETQADPVSEADAGAMLGKQVETCRQSKAVFPTRLWRPPNNRMQLTWLTGAPIRAGLGSPARRRAKRPRFTRHAADASR